MFKLRSILCCLRVDTQLIIRFILSSSCGISGCISPSDEVLNTIIFAGSKPSEDYKDVNQQNNVL